jgi:predicted transcriptional regulator
MKLELDLPDELVADLYQQCSARGLPADVYAAELVYQSLANQALGADGSLDNRPDWQAALTRSREDLASGRVVTHEEVEAWHKSHPE